MEVIEVIRAFVAPCLTAFATEGVASRAWWPPGGPWREGE
jgi:hypothetical protein